MEIRKTEHLIKTFSPENKPTDKEREQFIDFLFKHLENFGDPRQDIEKCVQYAFKETDSDGGQVHVMYDQKGDVVGTVIINQTGMKKYIPENILVYIATHSDCRGKGLGKRLMKYAIDHTEGDIALHVEPHNPAKFLYEKLGFTNKYLEMRLKK